MHADAIICCQGCRHFNHQAILQGPKIMLFLEMDNTFGEFLGMKQCMFWKCAVHERQFLSRVNFSAYFGKKNDQ